MRKLMLPLLIIVFGAVAIAAYIFLGSATAFEGKKETLYIPSKGASKKGVIDSLERNKIVSNTSAFSFLADRMGYWERIKPGKYDVPRGTSMLKILRMLRNGQQSAVNLVITKLRTPEDFARLTGNRFEFDSAQMIAVLNSTDSLKEYNVLPHAALSAVLPDTYTFLWNTSPRKVYARLADEAKKFWNSDRVVKAAEQRITPEQATIVASIVEEETNAASEKGEVASVYLNRLAIGMPLQADPTVKFALKDFGLKRIYSTHLAVESPYNTYRNKGLPPGPICTPSKKTIDAVLNAPKTNFIYFVASPKFDGTHEFSATYDEHLQKARRYQQALNRQDSIRKKLI
jgi:UPF0755 protein